MLQILLKVRKFGSCCRGSRICLTVQPQDRSCNIRIYFIWPIMKVCFPGCPWRCCHVTQDVSFTTSEISVSQSSKTPRGKSRYLQRLPGQRRTKTRCGTCCGTLVSLLLVEAKEVALEQAPGHAWKEAVGRTKQVEDEKKIRVRSAGEKGVNIIVWG